MLNQRELNIIQGVMHYLNSTDSELLCFDVQIIDPNGDRAGRLEYTGDDYQFFYPAPVTP